MRVLYINLRRILKNTTAGGETHIVDLIRGIEGMKINPYIFYPHGGKTYILDWNNNREHEYAGSSTIDIFGNTIIEENFLKIIRDFSIDVVHFQNFQTLPLSLIKIAKGERKKIVMTVHDYFLWCDNYTLLSPVNNGNKLSFCFFEKNPDICSACLTSLAFQPSSTEYVKKRRKFINDLLEMVDRFIFPSEYPRSIVLSLYENMVYDKCEVIEHGINKISVQSHESSAGDGNRLHIAFLGALRKAKGSDSFISLVESLKHRKDIRFFIFGRIEDKINTTRTNLYLLGEYNRNDLFSLLKKHRIDVILLLSPWPETYSYTLTEAIISGIPVISTDLGALRERVSKYFAGWLVPYENPVERIVSIINDILKDKEILILFKKRLHESSKKIPSLQEMSGKYMELYKSLF